MYLHLEGHASNVRIFHLQLQIFVLECLESLLDVLDANNLEHVDVVRRVLAVEEALHILANLHTRHLGDVVVHASTAGEGVAHRELLLQLRELPQVAACKKRGIVLLVHDGVRRQQLDAACKAKRGDRLLRVRRLGPNTCNH